MPSDWSLCAPTGECPHLISEGTETTGTRESANQGRLCAYTHIPELAYHKKRVGRSREHQDTSWKKKPTNKGNTNIQEQKKVKEGVEVTLSQPTAYLKIQLNGEEITKNKQLNKSKRKASKPCRHGRTSSNTTCPHLHNRKQEVGDRLTLR